MRISGKQIFNDISNTDREEKNHKKRKNKLESPEKDDEENSQIKTERMSYKKIPKKKKKQFKRII